MVLLAANLSSDFWKAAVPCITTLCVSIFMCLPLSIYQEEDLLHLPAGNLRLAEAARETPEKETHSWCFSGGFHHSPAWVGCSYLSPLSWHLQICSYSTCQTKKKSFPTADLMLNYRMEPDSYYYWVLITLLHFMALTAVATKIYDDTLCSAMHHIRKLIWQCQVTELTYRLLSEFLLPDLLPYLLDKNEQLALF